MKNFLIVMTLFASMSSFASECVISNIDFTYTTEVAGKKPLQEVETELVKKGYIIDENDLNGLSVHFGYYQARVENPKSGAPTFVDFGKAVGHLVTGYVFSKALEVEVSISDAQKQLLSHASKKMNIYHDSEEMALAVLDQIPNCN